MSFTINPSIYNEYWDFVLKVKYCLNTDEAHVVRERIILKRKREKGREVIDFSVWLVISILACMLTACGDSEADLGPQAERDRYEEKLDTDPQAPGNPAFRAEPDNGYGQDEEIQRYLQQATVQIKGPRYIGSGVIWAVYEDTLVVATAAHVTEENCPMTVQFDRGDPLHASRLLASDQVDVAFLELSLQEIEEQEIEWQAARQDKEICDRLEPGQPLWIMGSIEEAADRAYEGSVAEPWIYIEDFDNYMLLCHAYAIPGVSGGGVFTQEGILVGILCGGNEADQVAVLPWSVMEASAPTRE